MPDDRDDFVRRLRVRWDAMGDMANDERAAAADKIEFLRRSQRELMAKVAALTAERDEARREVCRDEAMLRLQRHRVHRDSEEVVLKAKEISVERGWDCFKEDSDE